MLDALLIVLAIALLASPTIVAIRRGVDYRVPGSARAWLSSLDHCRRRELDGAVWLAVGMLIFAAAT